MRHQNIALLLIILFSYLANAQNMSDYTSSWEGMIENAKSFNPRVEVMDLGMQSATFKLSNGKYIIAFPFESNDTKHINIPFNDNLRFEGTLSKDRKEINGFIKSGLLLYHIKLTKSKTNAFVGVWNILMVDELLSRSFYLSVENGSDDDYQAYPILADDRFTGTWCGNFQKEKDQITFTDFKTGLNFKGKLLTDKIQLGVYIGKNLLTNVVLKKSEKDWKIGGFVTDHISSILKVREMEDLIAKDSLVNTHAVVISKNGEMVYENYFDGYNGNVPHDMRSASKSISSAIVGIAKDQSKFKSVDQSIFEFLPKKYQAQNDDAKSRISIESLLTMSSGLDAIDYGINANPNSPAVEDNYQNPSKDWTASVLSAQMINEPNTKANYGSANPYLLGIAMDSVVSEPLDLFMDKNLFQKLEISNYIIQTDLKGIPYFGGGMYLTPRDMLKFGELYLYKGKWKSNRVLAKKWVKKSIKNHRVLENTEDKNGYGYLWWHNAYQVNGKNIKTIEARGAGGQYIFIVPCSKSVVVITSGNYRNGKTQQPEIIFENQILPYLYK